MARINKKTNQASLDNLRKLRRKLYALPEVELSALSLDDQVAYGDNLHKIGVAILKLEIAELKGVSAAFKRKESSLKAAIVKLEKDTASLSEAVKTIRVLSRGLTLITDIVSLLS